jgi:hypothetical protein
MISTVQADFLANRARLSEYVRSDVTFKEYLALTDKFDVFDEHPETLRDFLATYRRGYDDGYNDGYDDEAR